SISSTRPQIAAPCPYTTLFRSALHCQRHPAPRRLFDMSPSPSGASTAPADLTLVPRPEATIAPAVPLALLESVRAHDRPSEVLEDRKSTRLNSSHVKISYAVFC